MGDGALMLAHVDELERLRAENSALRRLNAELAGFEGAIGLAAKGVPEAPKTPQTLRNYDKLSPFPRPSSLASRPPLRGGGGRVERCRRQLAGAAMSEIVERVKAALARRRGQKYPQGVTSLGHADLGLDARAAIDAMRNYVTHDMTEAGRYALQDCIGDELGEKLEPDICARVFKVMVDEALG